MPPWSQERNTVLQNKHQPYMLGWEAEGASWEISENHNKESSHPPPGSLEDGDSLEVARNPSCHLGICCSSHSFAWKTGQKES